VLPHVVVRLAVEDDVGDIDLRRDRGDARVRRQPVHGARRRREDEQQRVSFIPSISATPDDPRRSSAVRLTEAAAVYLQGLGARPAPHRRTP